MPKVNDKFICVETVRDGEGPCMLSDEGECGYPLVEINETCRVVLVTNNRVFLRVRTRIISVSKQMVDKFFKLQEQTKCQK